MYDLDPKNHVQLSVNSPPRQYGGCWTTEKLAKVRKYLKAYVKVFKNQINFRTIYIDAFAGSGYLDLKVENSKQLLCEAFGDETADRFISGSARLALEIEPSFDYFYFVEKDKTEEDTRILLVKETRVKHRKSHEHLKISD